jgi:AraC-like DNA-binding protein
VVLPDGAIDLLYDANEMRLSVVGTMTRALWVDASAPSAYFGIRFTPAGASAWLRERADAFTDRKVDASDVFGGASELAERMYVGDRSTVDAFLLERRAGVPDRRVASGARILSDDPTASVEVVAESLGMTRQHARRLFLENVGVAPKTFARNVRVARGAVLIREGTALARAASLAGYADQAHFSREFREIVGATPTDYLRALAPREG